MLKRNYLYIIASVCLSVIVTQLQSCKEEEIPVFNYEDCLFFDKYDSDRERIDTAFYSFSHYPTQEILTHQFKISLIGNPLTEDKEYSVTVLEGKDADDQPYTTAKPGQYSLPEKLLFRKDVASDSLEIMMIKEKVEDGEEVYLTVRLTANENFSVGYYDYKDIKLRFNNKIMTPLWWNKEITDTIFGEYSLKKLKTIIEANPDFTSPEGLSSTYLRKIGLITVKYISDNGITEEDGSEMKLPIY